MSFLRQEKIVVDAAINNVTQVTDFTDSVIEDYGVSPKSQAQIDIAIDEIFSNVAKYAYHPKNGKITVMLGVSDGPLKVTITFIDNGYPFNPLKALEPDLSPEVRARMEGGLGIHIVKKTMDDITYEYKNNKNILTIVKAL